MTDDLIAYLMDDLSPERRAEVDAKLETDVVWRWELERLRECMTAADGDASSCGDAAPAAAGSAVPASSTIDESSVDIEPPRDLVKKTCCFVEDSASGKFKVEKKRCSKKQAAFTAEAAGACKRSWTLADVTVASGVGLILAALILPAIQNSRSDARVTQCTANLKSFGAAGEKYNQNLGFLPTVDRGEAALVYLTKMVDQGVLTPGEAFEISACPDSIEAQRRSDGLTLNRLPTTLELASATGIELVKMIALSNVSYAMPTGYLANSGEVRPPKFNPGSEEPLVTDAPVIGPTVLRPNSHGGCMQNVLNASGCVRPYSLCVLTRSDQRMRDIHLNDDGIPASGRSPADIFLAPADYGPDGPIALRGVQNVRIQIMLVPAPVY